MVWLYWAAVAGESLAGQRPALPDVIHALRWISTVTCTSSS